MRLLQAHRVLWHRVEEACVLLRSGTVIQLFRPASACRYIGYCITVAIGTFLWSRFAPSVNLTLYL